jgi:hypothetical protein
MSKFAKMPAQSGKVLFQFRQYTLPEKVAHIDSTFVRRILPPALSASGEIFFYLGSPRKKEWAYKTPPKSRHARKGAYGRSTKEFIEYRFGLIIGCMCQRYAIIPFLTTGALQKCVARVSRQLLGVSRQCAQAALLTVKGNAQPCRALGSKVHIRKGFVPPEPMFVMGAGKADIQFGTQFMQQKKQGERIRAA